MNQILEDILDKRKGHYVHAFEVGSVYDLQCIIDQICSEYSHCLIGVIISFLESAELICTNEENEGDVYNFNIGQYVIECI